MENKFDLWQSLKRPSIGKDQQAALVAAKALFENEQLIAVDPSNGDGRTVVVHTAVPKTYRHILFKAEGDTYDRLRPDSECGDDFQGDRAERIWWIPEVLKKPERIHYHDDVRVRGAGMYFYNTDVADDEVFAVLVRINGRRYSLTTAYSMSGEEWLRKRRGTREHPSLRQVR